MLHVARRSPAREGAQKALHAQPFFPLRHPFDLGRIDGWPTSSSVRAGAPFGSKFSRSRKASNVALAMSWASSTATTACRPLSALAARNARCGGRSFARRGSRRAAGAVELVGQVGQQIGRRHLRKDQMHERRELLAQHAAEHGRDERFARARGSGQQGGAAAVLDGVAELQQRGLVRLGRDSRTADRRRSRRAFASDASRFRTWLDGSSQSACDRCELAKRPRSFRSFRPGELPTATNCRSTSYNCSADVTGGCEPEGRRQLFRRRGRSARSPVDSMFSSGPRSTKTIS